MGKIKGPILAYFISWFSLVILALILNALNVDWQVAHPFQGVVVVLVLTVLEASACEFLLMTIVSIAYSGLGGTKRPQIERRYNHNLTLIINFNVLAHSEGDIDDAFCHMYQSFMTNLSPDVSAVLLSATGNENLKEYEIKTRDNYRALIKKILTEEGEYILAGQIQHVDAFRLRYFWKNFKELPENELISNLPGIANQVAKEFMCIHRVTRVLKKCGQYQDLFLLSEGEKLAFTYTDEKLYDRMARKHDEPMFYDSIDVNNIHDRNFDYTLVMDNDTVCPPGTAHELLAVAAAHPERGIIQPAIKMDVTGTDTLYMHLEMWRQRLNEPLSRSMALLFDQWGFYGKGMIQNKLYVEKMIGTREKLIEMVPIEVLSHDTYEAAVLRPLYVDSLYFEEEPSYNYITWHIRERRWNQGELILSQFFWPRVFGKSIGFLRRLFDKRNYIKTHIRTKCDFSLVSSHVAHCAVRSMFTKPLMLGYVILQLGVPMHQPFVPLAGVLFMVCIVPKFAVTNWANARFAVLEMFASILQYTPEAFIGSVRLGQAIFATVCKSCTENWTPQRVVEEDMRSSNPFSASIRHLWSYSVLAVVAVVIIAVWAPGANLIYLLLVTIIIIPFFTGFTSLTPNLKVIRVLSVDENEDLAPDPRPLDALMEEGKASKQGPSEGVLKTPRDNISIREAAYYIDEEVIPRQMRVRSRERYKSRSRSPVKVLEVDDSGQIVRRSRIEVGVDAMREEGLSQRRRNSSPSKSFQGDTEYQRRLSVSPSKEGNLRGVSISPSGISRKSSYSPSKYTRKQSLSPEEYNKRTSQSPSINSPRKLSLSPSEYYRQKSPSKSPRKVSLSPAEYYRRKSGSPSKHSRRVSYSPSEVHREISESPTTQKEKKLLSPAEYYRQTSQSPGAKAKPSRSPHKKEKGNIDVLDSKSDDKDRKRNRSRGRSRHSRRVRDIHDNTSSSTGLESTTPSNVKSKFNFVSGEGHSSRKVTILDPSPSSNSHAGEYNESPRKASLNSSKRGNSAGGISRQQSGSPRRPVLRSEQTVSGTSQSPSAYQRQSSRSPHSSGGRHNSSPVKYKKIQEESVLEESCSSPSKRTGISPGPSGGRKTSLSPAEFYRRMKSNDSITRKSSRSPSLGKVPEMSRTRGDRSPSKKFDMYRASNVSHSVPPKQYSSDDIALVGKGKKKSKHGLPKRDLDLPPTKEFLPENPSLEAKDISRKPRKKKRHWFQKGKVRSPYEKV